MFHKMLIGAAALMTITVSAPCVAQDSSMKPGSMWVAARIDVEEGQMENYRDYLTKVWMANQDYAKSQGWLLDYHVLQSVNPRDGEPNIILITRFADMPTAAESERRSEIMNKRMSQTDRAATAASGDRNKMREIMGSVLYREMVKR
ncbi:MAG: hypothetical protein V4696_08430 [Pseudomonadota bacterium]